MIERTATFLDALTAAQDLDGVFAAYRRLAEAVGFPETVIGASRLAGSAENVTAWRTTIPAVLAEAAFRDDVLERNPLYVMARLATRPFASHLELYRDLPMLPWQREMYESDIAQASTLRIGLPAVDAPNGLRWGVSVGGDYPLREVDRILGERSEVLWLAGAALAARLGQISVDGTRPPHGRLTPTRARMSPSPSCRGSGGPHWRAARDFRLGGGAPPSQRPPSPRGAHDPRGGSEGHPGRPDRALDQHRAAAWIAPCGARLAQEHLVVGLPDGIMGKQFSCFSTRQSKITGPGSGSSP
jgi:hypothetical protein